MRPAILASALVFGGLGVGGVAMPLRAQGVSATVATIDGRSVRGEVTVAQGGKVTVRTGEAPVVFGLDEIASIAVDGAESRPAEAPCHVWLRSGVEYAATELRGVASADGRPARLSLTLPLGVTFELPMTTVRAFRHGGDERPAPPSFGGDLADPADNSDLLWVQKDGKQHRLRVTVLDLRPDAIEFELRGRKREFPFDGVLGVVFGNNTGFAVDPQRPPRVTAECVTGDRLEGLLVGLGERVRLRLDEGCEVVFPSDRLIRLSVASDRVLWLSELEPRVEQTPAFNRVWPWTRDRSTVGPGFLLGGRHFERGLGMMPRTRLTYDLGRRYDVFRASIGIDDRGGPEAHAVFRVLVDGKVVFESAPKTLGMPPEPISVDLAGCEQLALEVDFGKNYDLGDACAFADARVMR